MQKILKPLALSALLAVAALSSQANAAEDPSMVTIQIKSAANAMPPKDGVVLTNIDQDRYRYAPAIKEAPPAAPVKTPSKPPKISNAPLPPMAAVGGYEENVEDAVPLHPTSQAQEMLVLGQPVKAYSTLTQAAEDNIDPFAPPKGSTEPLLKLAEAPVEEVVPPLNWTDPVAVIEWAQENPSKALIVFVTLLTIVMALFQFLKGLKRFFRALASDD